MGGETALGMQGFGAGMSAVGSYFSAQGQKSTLKTQANIDETNAKLAEATAQSALLQGQRQEQASNISYANIKSTQKAAFAANGVSLDSQVVANVGTSNDVLKEVDAATIAANAGRSAFGAREAALSYTNRAAAARAQAKSISPITSVATSLMGSAGTVASTWYQLDKVGAFDQKVSNYGPQNDILSRTFGENLVSRVLF